MKLNSIEQGDLVRPVNSDVWSWFLQALHYKTMSNAQCELLSNVSYGWNVLKRINNCYFSSNSLLFLTNPQQLKAFDSPGGLLQWECI